MAKKIFFVPKDELDQFGVDMKQLLTDETTARQSEYLAQNIKLVELEAKMETVRMGKLVDGLNSLPEAGAQVNTIEKVKVGTTEVTDDPTDALKVLANELKEDYKLKVEKVTDLPAEGEYRVVYLKGSDEYIWTGSDFEKIGTCYPDLSGYQVQSEISGLVEKTDVVTAEMPKVVVVNDDELESANYGKDDDGSYFDCTVILK